MQLSNQHHQIKIFEASHFCIILELVTYKFIFQLSNGNKQLYKKCAFWQYEN